jgi:hypothetical protein
MSIFVASDPDPTFHTDSEFGIQEHQGNVIPDLKFRALQKNVLVQSSCVRELRNSSYIREARTTNRLVQVGSNGG